MFRASGASLISVLIFMLRDLEVKKNLSLIVLLGYVFKSIILVQFSLVPVGPFQYVHFGLFLFPTSLPGLQF